MSNEKLSMSLEEAINGVVLYENMEHDTTVYGVDLPDVNYTDYERYELTIVDHGRAPVGERSDAKSLATVVFTSFEFALAATKLRELWKAVTFVHDLDNGNSFLFGGAYMCFDDTTNGRGLRFQSDDNVRNFALMSVDGKPVLDIKPTGTYYVHIERIVAYPKLTMGA